LRSKNSRGGRTAPGISEAARWLPRGVLVRGDTICEVFILDSTARSKRDETPTSIR
jgi:hypothetical protein